MSLFASLDGQAAGQQASFELAPPFSTVSHADWARAVRFWREHGAPLLADQPPRACPACGSHAQRPAFTSYDGYPFAECLECGCWFVPLQVDQALFERYLLRHPQAGELVQPVLDKRASAENLAQDLERIGAYLDTLRAAFEPGGPLRYLDIGAGMGSSLIAARDRGMRAVGVEVDAQGVRVALERGLDMRNPAQGLPEGPFDLISLWESLEHISDPLGVLTSAAARLAPGGLVAVTVPNLDSPMARLMREDAPFICGGPDGAGHINMLGPEQMRRLLERAGLELALCDGQYASNLPELAGYLLGRHRGAASLLDGKAVSYKLPAPLARGLAYAGQVIELAERTSGLSPILFAVAARKGDAQVSPAVARLAAHRDKTFAARAEEVSRNLPDYQALLEELDAMAHLWRRRALWWRYILPRRGS